MTRPTTRTEIKCEKCNNDLYLLDESGPVQFLSCFVCMVSYTYEEENLWRLR